MFNIFLYGSVVVLFFVCALVVLLVLMQRPSSNAGVGSALGGSASESVLGGEAASVLSKATAIFITLFFLLCAGLYFGFVAKSSESSAAGDYTMQASAAPQSLVTKDEVAVPAPASENVPAKSENQ